jgi:uncharacterized protein YqeY
VDEWKTLLRSALRDAIRGRQMHAINAIRGALGAIDNAEAADASAAPAVQQGVIAGGVSGLGAGDVPRRLLTVAAVREIVEREIHEHHYAAAAYLQMGRHDEASALQRQADVLAALLSEALAASCHPS